MSKLNIPNMMAFSRSINPTDALMFGVNSQTGEEYPVEVVERGMRAPFSNYKESKSAEKDPARGNPKFGETAFLSENTDTLRLKFSVVLTGNSRAPYACESKSAEMRDALKALTKNFKEKGGYRELASRYLEQIAKGDVAWRNLELTDEVSVDIQARQSKVVVTNSPKGQSKDNPEAYEEILTMVEKALGTEKGFVRLNVTVDMPMAPMTEVFPSQVFKEGETRKLLAGIQRGNLKHGLIYSQKIGNAIRRIDDWYDDDAYPLAVEPFGIDRSLDQAVRIEKKRDFYTLLTKNLLEFVDHSESAGSADDLDGDVFYFVACLIRGGVFSGKDA